MMTTCHLWDLNPGPFGHFFHISYTIHVCTHDRHRFSHHIWHSASSQWTRITYGTVQAPNGHASHMAQCVVPVYKILWCKPFFLIKKKKMNCWWNSWHGWFNYRDRMVMHDWDQASIIQCSSRRSRQLHIFLVWDMDDTLPLSRMISCMTWTPLNCSYSHIIHEALHAKFKDL